MGKVKLEILKRKEIKQVGTVRFYYIINLDSYYYEYSTPKQDKEYIIDDICLDILDVFHIFRRFDGLSTSYSISQFLLEFDYRNMEDALDCINHIHNIANRLLKIGGMDDVLLTKLNEIYMNGDPKLYEMYRSLIRDPFEINYLVCDIKKESGK